MVCLFSYFTHFLVLLYMIINQFIFSKIVYHWRKYFFHQLYWPLFSIKRGNVIPTAYFSRIFIMLFFKLWWLNTNLFFSYSTTKILLCFVRHQDGFHIHCFFCSLLSVCWIMYPASTCGLILLSKQYWANVTKLVPLLSLQAVVKYGFHTFELAFSVRIMFRDYSIKFTTLLNNNIRIHISVCVIIFKHYYNFFLLMALVFKAI